MLIFAIDPGPKQSAFVVYDSHLKSIIEKGIRENSEIMDVLDYWRISPRVNIQLCVEMIACYGMPVGAEVFETCVWIGRFVEHWKRVGKYVYRKEIKLHFCNSVRAKDPNIRQALIDRFGKIGTKNNPGPLYGITSHIWPALAVAVYSADKL